MLHLLLAIARLISMQTAHTHTVSYSSCGLEVSTTCWVQVPNRQVLLWRPWAVYANSPAPTCNLVPIPSYTYSDIQAPVFEPAYSNFGCPNQHFEICPEDRVVHYSSIPEILCCVPCHCDLSLTQAFEQFLRIMLVAQG